MAVGLRRLPYRRERGGTGLAELSTHRGKQAPLEAGLESLVKSPLREEGAWAGEKAAE